MPGQNPTERFVQQLTGAQTRLLAYITMLLGHPAAAGDVLQETNLVLWRKADEFIEGRDFAAWAYGIARFQVLAHQRDARRDRHRFDETLVAALADEAEASLDELEVRRGALRECLESLAERQRELVRGRYALDESIDQLATRTGRSSGSVAMALSRIRQTLLDCIERRLAGERNR